MSPAAKSRPAVFAAKRWMRGTSMVVVMGYSGTAGRVALLLVDHRLSMRQGCGPCHNRLFKIWHGFAAKRIHSRGTSFLRERICSDIARLLPLLPVLHWFVPRRWHWPILGMARGKETQRAIRKTARSMATRATRATRESIQAAVIGIMAQASIGEAFLALWTGIGTTGPLDLRYHPAFKRTSPAVNRFRRGLPRSSMAG